MYSLSECKHVDMVDLFWKVNLLLLVNNPETCMRHKSLKDIQITTDAAVHLIRDHAFI